MNEFIILLSKIMFIAFLQSLFETFVNASKRPYLTKLISILSLALCFYFLTIFILNHFEVLKNFIN